MEKLRNDNPIKELSQDTLNRSESAKQFASNIFSFDISEGLVVGILGEWGSGKTSYINMMREEISKRSSIVEFNPWMFSDVENLVECFFSELTAQLKTQNHHELNKNLKRYGSWLDKFDGIPIIESWTKTLSFWLKSFAFIHSIKTGGLSGLRDKLIKDLTNLEKPIVVILDDVDRLSSAEIREIFKLVRLTASFPNIIYLLAFDKLRVEQALSEQEQVDGKAYLEKILQLSFDIPKISHNQLQKNLIEALDKELNTTPISFDKKRWGNILYEIISPNIQNMRDVNRYVLSVSSKFKEIGNKIEAVDILALEAIRLFKSNVFHQIYQLRDILTTKATDNSVNIDGENKKKINVFLKEDKQCKEIIENIFPMAEKYLERGARYSSEYNSLYKKQKRLANQMFFDLYFEMCESSELCNYNNAQSVWLTMSDPDKFKNNLKNIPKSHLEDVIKNLIDFEDEFTERHVLAAIPFLFEIVKEIPEKPRTFFSFHPKVSVSILVYRLIRSIPENNRSKIVNELMQITNLSGRLEIIEIVGYTEGRGHKLLPENEVRILREKLLEDIKSASEIELINEFEILSLLSLLRNNMPDAELPILKSKKIFFEILKSAKSEIIGQSVGSYYTNQEDILFWEWLTSLYKSERELCEMIDLLNSDHTLKNEPIMVLANKYRNGWRDSGYPRRELTQQS